MPEHLAESQPKHADPGMDALIRHLEAPTNDAEVAEIEPTVPTVPTEEPEDEPPLAAEAEGEEVQAEDDLGDDPLVPVMVDGVEQMVPFSEALQGYSRTADYTRKTQAIAEERRQLEAERSQLMLAQREAVQRAANAAAQLEAQVQAQHVDPQELERLRVADPAEYAARIADEQRRSTMIAQAQQEVAAFEQQQRAIQIQTSRQTLAESDPAFAKDFEGTYADLGRWVTDPKGGNVPLEEWNRETDPRRILIAYRAMVGDKQSATAKDRASSVRAKVATLPRIRSGARHEPGQTESANYATAMKKMGETDSTRDIARALMARGALKNARRDGDGYP